MTAGADSPRLRLEAGCDEWLDMFAVLARAAILERWRPDSCVASTRTGLLVLRHFGIRARPRPVTTMAFTRDRYELWAAGKNVVDVGHGLGIGIGPQPGAISCDALGRKRWTGHMIIQLTRRPVLVDLSIDQAHRPELGLDLSRPVVLDIGDATAFDAGERVTVVDPRTSNILIYQRMLDDTGDWPSEPDWAGRDAEVIGTADKIIEALTPTTIRYDGS